MRLNEVRYNDSKPVEGYGSGFFRIGGKVHRGPIVALPTGVIAWGGLHDAATLLAYRDDLDVVFIGTGAEVAHLPDSFREAMDEAGIGVEPMASPAACRTYNVLLSEGRRVAVALIPV